MLQSRSFQLMLAFSALLFASLACSFLDDPEIILDDEPTSAVRVSAPSPEASADTDPSPTLEPTQAPLQLPRLDSSSLPELDFGPVGPSPNTSGRVNLSGDPQSLDTEHFRIHYTLTGADAVDSADSNGNGHPEFVEQVAIALEHAYYAEVEYFSWPAPPSDEGLGGNDLYDVYLENIFDDGTAGYVDGGYSETIVGDNPNSSLVESNASHSFMALDNDYDGFEEFETGGVSALDFMRSTAAHEFMHAIQYGFDSFEPHDWLWEASANWIQDEILNDYNDAIEDALAVFQSPDSCQLAYGGEDRIEDENHWYGLWIFMRYYSENYGHQAVRGLWDAAIVDDGYEAWSNELASEATTLNVFFSNFSAALLLRDFEEGANYPSVRLEGSVSTGEEFIPESGVGQMGADYLAIDASGPITIELIADDMAGLVIGLDSSGEAHYFPLLNNEIGLDAAPFEYLFLIVLNHDQATSEEDCTFADYSVQVLAGADDLAKPSHIQSAPNFTPPSVNSISGGEPSGEAGGEEPEELALVYLPSGYEFVAVYELSRDDFEDPDFVDAYIPAPGPATVLDYWGPGEEDYISLYANESPYDDLDEFTLAINFEPFDEDWREIAGYDVILEDFSDGSDYYTVATVIVDGLFLVFDGTISDSEMTEVVRSWLLWE